MSNFLHHSMEPVDPLTLPGGPRSRRNTAAAAAASSHSRPASVHNTEPVTHQRGVPERKESVIGVVWLR